ncbi:MAG: spore germination protein GerW family protein, partial [Sulfurovum sp.]
MEHVKDVLKTSLEELERVLDTKTVVGEPIVIEGNTLIPLISIGFGFGAGGGTGKSEKGDDEGVGAGTGGGGGIRPV